MNIIEDGVIPGAQYIFRPITNFAAAPPTINQWYTVLEANNVLLQYLTIQHTSTDALAKVIQVRITADGTVITGSVSIPSAQWNSVFLIPFLTDMLNYQTTIIAVGYAIPWYARSMKIEIRTTGTNPQTLTASARWWTL